MFVHVCLHLCCVPQIPSVHLHSSTFMSADGCWLSSTSILLLQGETQTDFQFPGNERTGFICLPAGGWFTALALFAPNVYVTAGDFHLCKNQSSWEPCTLLEWSEIQTQRVLSVKVLKHVAQHVAETEPNSDRECFVVMINGFQQPLCASVVTCRWDQHWCSGNL